MKFLSISDMVFMTGAFKMSTFIVMPMHVNIFSSSDISAHFLCKFSTFWCFFNFLLTFDGKKIQSGSLFALVFMPWFYNVRACVCWECNSVKNVWNFYCVTCVIWFMSAWMLLFNLKFCIKYAFVLLSYWICLRSEWKGAKKVL